VTRFHNNVPLIALIDSRMILFVSGLHLMSHVHLVRPFLLGQMEIVNGLVILKKLKILLGVYCKFLKIRGKIEKIVKL
jgi:hypothetical protein